MSDTLLEQWRATRDPLLAEQLRQTVASGAYLPLPTGTDVNRAWDEAAARHDVEWFRVVFLSALHQVTSLAERIEKFAELDDPRFVDLATRVATSHHATPAVKAATVRLVGRLRDSRHATWIELFEDECREAVREARAALRGRPLVAAEHTRLLRPRGEAIDPLFDAVYAAPADLSLRRVLADALMEKGEPRGEFIALQLDGKQSQREQELLRAHGATWARPFQLTTRGNLKNFTNGFLSVVVNDGLRLDEQSHFVEWSTVEHFISTWTNATRAHLEVIARAQGLRSLFWAWDSVLAEISSETLEVLGIRGEIQDLTRFPKLRVLVCRNLEPDARFPKVEHFAVITNDWDTWLSRERSEAGTFSLITDSMPRFPDVVGWKLTCSRERNELTWLGRSHLDVPELAMLDEIHVKAPSAERARIEAVLGRRLASFKALGETSLEKPSFERLGWF
ncbi:MAG: TIGR02996 domain-containing protein [Archangium sp.]